MCHFEVYKICQRYYCQLKNMPNALPIFDFRIFLQNSKKEPIKKSSKLDFYTFGFRKYNFIHPEIHTVYSFTGAQY